MKLTYLFLILFSAFPVFGQIDLSVIEASYTEDFNSLAESPEGTIISPVSIPAGWLVYDNGSEDQYKVSNGASNTGNIYSYGSVGDPERSLGSFRSTLGQQLYFGAFFENNTGKDIYYLKISFTVEQWRRATNLNDSLVLEFSYDATDLTSGLFETIEAGSVSAIQSGPSGALDGNQPDNQLALSFIYSCFIPQGSTFVLRWRDDNTTPHAGLAVDDFSITPYEFMHYYDNNPFYTDLLSWGVNPNGTGASPASFTDVNQVFHFRNHAVVLNQPWNLSDGSDTNLVVNETTTLVLQNDNVVAKFILDANSVIALEGANNLVIEYADALSVIDFNYGSTNPALINFDTCGILNLNSGSTGFRFNSDLTVKNTLEIWNNVFAYVPETVTISGPVNVYEYAEVECERFASVSFNTLDLNSFVTYSGTGALFEDEDTIYNFNYGILKLKGVRTHVLGEDIVVNNYVEVTENNTINATGALDFSDYKLTGPGNFVAYNDAILLIRDSMGVEGSVKVTGEIHILDDVTIGYIGPLVKYSGNPYLDNNRLKTIGNSGPDLFITEDFYVSEVVQPYGGNINLNGHVIYLDPGAVLIEATGYTVLGDSGYVEYTDNFATSVNNPGQLGLTITSAQNLGVTTIRRGHAVQTNGINESIRRYFDIMPAANSALDATLRMYYVDDAYLRNGLDESTFEFFQSTDEGETWIEKPASVNNTSLNYVELTNIPSFSRWTIASWDSPLPVQLLSFTARNEGDQTIISWETATETNCSHFILQKSSDGISYTDIATVPGKGTSSVNSFYKVTDKEKNSDVWYYRLVQADLDGRTQFFGPVSVKVEHLPYVAYDYAWKEIQVFIPESEQAHLYNSNGQFIRSFYSGSYSSNSLGNGIYFLTYGNQKLKFIKQD